jgi:ribosomal protein L7/L12
MPNNSMHDDRIAELERRVMRLEQQLELVLGRLGFGDVRASGMSTAEIQDLLRRGNKIEAIKLYREQTGLGLKEAKDAVEAIERGLR